MSESKFSSQLKNQTVKEILDTLPGVTEPMLECSEVEKKGEMYVQINAKHHQRSELISLQKDGFLEMCFNMHYTDSDEKIRYYRKMEWKQEIKRLRTVYIRRYRMDSSFALNDILKCVSGLCDEAWKPKFSDDIEDFRGCVCDSASIALDRFVLKEDWDLPVEESEKEAKASEKAACKQFLDKVKQWCKQNKSKFNPHKEEQLLVKIENVFRDAMIELKRRNKLPRIAISVEDMGCPNGKSKIYDEFEIKTISAEAPARIDREEWQAMKKQVRKRLQDFLRENGDGTSDASIRLDSYMPMPKSWLNQWEKQEYQTGYQPMKYWGFYQSDFLKRDKQDDWMCDVNEHGNYDEEYKITKIDWEIRKTEDWERLLGERRLADEKEKKATKNKGHQREKVNELIWFPPIEVVVIDIPFFKKFDIGKKWLTTKEVHKRIGLSEGYLRTIRKKDREIQHGEECDTIGIDARGYIYCIHSKRAYYYWQTIEKEGKKRHNFYKKYLKEHSK